MRPGIVKMGQPKKYSENLLASRVAEVTISFRSGRRLTMPLSRPNSTSVWMVRSCASSSMITLRRVESSWEADEEGCAQIVRCHCCIFDSQYSQHCVKN